VVVTIWQGTVKADSLKYAEGRKGGFDPHARIVDMDPDGIDAVSSVPASVCLPAPSRITNSLPQCAAL
jgi:hypothetical protein